MSKFHWLEPWHAVEDQDERKGLETELAREICEKHVLYRQEVTAIARASDNDDVLFLLLDGRVAEVHLVWQGRQPDPRWPSTGIFSSLAVWATQSMIPRHRDWTADD